MNIELHLLDRKRKKDKWQKESW